MELKIIKEQPPFLLQIQLAGMKPERTTIYPFGTTIYNPSGELIPEDIMIHEAVHVAQQGKNPKSWWNKYILDKDFRLSQELEANREQYKFICKITKDREKRNKALVAMAKNMSGEVYNVNISFQEAYQKIKI